MADNRHLRQKPFLIPDNPLQTAKAWETWLDEIEREFRYFRISTSEDKVDALLIFGGPEICRLSKCLPDIDVVTVEGEEPQRDEYTKLTDKLSNHFKPRQNKQHAR